jgi:hypothetical protein
VPYAKIFGGTRADLADVYTLHAAGRARVIDETRQLSSANDAIQEVMQGKARARLVLASRRESSAAPLRPTPRPSPPSQFQAALFQPKNSQQAEDSDSMKNVSARADHQRGGEHVTEEPEIGRPVRAAGI